MATTNRYPIFTALDADWRRFARSDTAREAVLRWRAEEPDLAELRTVADFLVLRKAPGRADRLLRAMTRLAPNDPLAARVVLQALVPGLIRLSSWFTDDEDEADTISGEAVAIAWDRICSFDHHRRPGPVAATVLGQVRRQLRHDKEPLGPVAQPDGVERSAEDVVVERLLFEELRDRDTVWLGHAEGFELVVESRVNGTTVAQLARARGVRPHSLLMRRHRAERRIRRYLDAA